MRSVSIALFALLVGYAVPAVAQVQQMQPDSPRFMNGQDPQGATWKVFAVDSYEQGPIGVVQVEEVPQQNPPSLWAVSVQNRGNEPVTSYRMTAVVVTGDNKIKGTQMLPAIKNLKPGQVSRQQIKIFPTILNPTDRVVFYVGELTAGETQWKADKAAVSALVTKTAARFPVQ